MPYRFDSYWTKNRGCACEVCDMNRHYFLARFDVGGVLYVFRLALS